MCEVNLPVDAPMRQLSNSGQTDKKEPVLRKSKSKMTETITEMTDESASPQCLTYAIEQDVKVISSDGGQATVYLTNLKSSSGLVKAFAAKKFRGSNDHNYRAELSILKEVGSHPRIVSYQDLDIIPTQYQTIFLEYCPSGDLVSYSDDLGVDAYVPEIVLWKLLYQMADVFAFLHHGKGTAEFDPENPYKRPYSFVHRDIKPENILLTGIPSTDRVNSIRKADFKLCDFGLAVKQYRGECAKPKGYLGTRDTQAPETAHHPYEATTKADLWSLGAMLHYLINSTDPLQGPCNNDCDKVYSRNRCCRESSTMDAGFRENAWTLPRNKWYSKEIVGWIRRCLSVDPLNRPTAIELLKGLEPTYKIIMAGTYDSIPARTPLPVDDMDIELTGEMERYQITNQEA